MENKYDDKVKNGIKTFIFGHIHWKIYHDLAKKFKNSPKKFNSFIIWFYESPQDLLPCVFCRRHYKGHTKKTQHNIKFYVENRLLEEMVYFLHNGVNSTLNKKVIEYDVNEPLNEQEFEDYFWLWLEQIAFNFPADIQITNYLTGLNKISVYSNFAFDSKEAEELNQRLKRYVMFFDLLKNYIPHKTLAEKWTTNYIMNPPNLLTFSTRTNLLKWFHQMKNACNHKKISFVEMLDNLHPMRSA